MNLLYIVGEIAKNNVLTPVGPRIPVNKEEMLLLSFVCIFGLYDKFDTF